MRKPLAKIHKYLHYNGLNREEYKTIEQEIDTINRTALKVCSTLSICLFGGMMLYAMLDPYYLYMSNFQSYLFATIISAISLFIALFVKNIHRKMCTFLALVWILMTVGISIRMAIIPESIEERTTLFLSLPIICPMMFCLSGYVLSGEMIFMEIVYLVTITLMQKEYPVYNNNVVNSIIMTILGLVVCNASMILRVKGIYNSRKTAAAEAASSAKTSFLFNMSHDIRTPMNAIIGFKELLEKNQENPEKRADYLKKIDESSHVLLSIINNVLEMARIEKGTISLEEAPINFRQSCDTFHSVFDEMMKQKGLKFSIEYDIQHEYLYYDRTKMREVIMNLLSNAYKYTEKGFVKLQFKELPCDEPGYMRLQAVVSDTGIGMSKEFLPHVFEEFSREQNTTEAKIEGTGLGMPIVKRLVELMDGTIEVNSIKEVGTNVTITFQLRIAMSATFESEQATEIDYDYFEGKRILLAEDNDLNAEIAMEILTDVGFIVERADNGQVVLDMLEEADGHYFDAILMDIQMPVMNGYEASRKIREMEDGLKRNIPIIAMTANAFEEDKHAAIQAGMNSHVSKPVDIQVLMQALAKNL